MTYPQRALELTRRAGALGRCRRDSAAATFASVFSDHAFEVAPVFGGRGAAGVVDRGVVLELALSLRRDHPKNAQV